MDEFQYKTSTIVTCKISFSRPPSFYRVKILRNSEQIKKWTMTKVVVESESKRLFGLFVLPQYLVQTFYFYTSETILECTLQLLLWNV